MKCKRCAMWIASQQPTISCSMISLIQERLLIGSSHQTISNHIKSFHCHYDVLLEILSPRWRGWCDASLCFGLRNALQSCQIANNRRAQILEAADSWSPESWDVTASGWNSHRICGTNKCMFRLFLYIWYLESKIRTYGYPSFFLIYAYIIYMCIYIYNHIYIYI